MKRVSYACLLIFVTALLAQMASAQLAYSPWPKFRGDYANSGQGIFGGAGSELTWTYTTGGPIRSAPVIGSDGTVYFTSNDGRLYAIAGDGTKKWDYICNCEGSSSPVVAYDGTIYVASSDKYIYAIRPDGMMKWRRLLANRITSSITLGVDGTIYVGCSDGKLCALWPDGTLKWSYTTGGQITSTPAIGPDGTIYVGSEDGKVYAFYSNGVKRWVFAPYAAGQFVASPAVGADGIIYIGSTAGYFYAIYPNGSQRWRLSSAGNIRSSAAIAPNGEICFGSRDSKLRRVNSLGQLQWTFSTNHYVDSSPAVAVDGVTYVGSLDGKIYALNADGTERWRYDTESAIFSSPAIGPAGALFVGAENGTLYCFAADSTPPEAPVVTDDGYFTCYTDRIRGYWEAVDQESAISSYEYCVGTAPGRDDIAPWINVGLVDHHLRSNLSLVDGETYYITARAVNGAGITGPEASSDGIVVDATPPSRPQVSDDGEYTSVFTTLHASWSSNDTQSGIERYHYSIGTSPGATNILSWTDVGPNTSMTEGGLNLEQGKTYYINVKACNTGGGWSEVGSSDGITIDITPPETPVVIDEGDYTSSPTSIFCRWYSSDDQSGIVEFEYSVGTTRGGQQILNWTSAGTSTEMSITGLELQEGITYYVNVRSTNGAGLVSSFGSSDGIMLDGTPPTPVVTDDGDYSTSSSDLHASWSVGGATNISSYKYAIGTTAGGTDVVSWTDAGSSTSVTRSGLTLTDGTTYYFSVKAVNSTGKESDPGISDGIMVDASSPTTPVVTDDGLSTMDETQIHATWSSDDPHTGVVKYEYSVGTSAGSSDVVAWTDAGTSTETTVTGLTMQPGYEYFVNVRATNAAGLVSDIGSSDGIHIESTPPTTPVVDDKIDFTSDTTQLSATWSAEDPETGVDYYEYAMGTAPGSSDIVSWTNAGLNTSATRTGLSLQHGITYYISVRATNTVGMTSEVGSSDGVTVDLTAPPSPTITDDGQFSAGNTRLHAVVSGDDPESGVIGYQCAVGTTPGGIDVLDWTDVGPGPDIEVTGLSLQDGVTYYISARAVNGAGLVGEHATADGVIVDATPPVGVTIADDGAFTGSSSEIHASWFASDPESGIRGYRYCIGTSAGANDVADWLDVGLSTEHTRTGLLLANGVTYYVTVIAVNGAGGESSPVSSDGIVVDLTPPSTPTVTDNGEYWGNRTTMYGEWNADDPESGVVEYAMSVGTSPGATDVADWQSIGSHTSYTRTGLMLKDGVTYYINIKAKNAAGSWSAVGSSDGILLDSTPPTPPTVVDDGDGTSVLDSLHCTWHSEDPESGIAEYMYCIGTSPGATDVRGWTSAGTSEEVTVTGLALDPVLRYYFSVKARSNSGAWSAVSASDGIGFSSGAAIWCRFRNGTTNRGQGLFAATTVNDLAWSVPTQGYVESSPAIAADGTAYIGSGDGNVYAVTQNGTIRWTYNAGAPIDSSPAIADDGSVLVGCNNGKLLRLDMSGNLIWEYEADGAVRSSPLVVNGTVYVGSTNGSLYAVDLETGLQNWSYSTGAGLFSSPAIDGNGVVYVGSQDAYLYAIDPGGALKWRFQTGSSIDCSPTIAADGTIYIGSGDGWFYAVNPDGSQKWRFETRNTSNSTAAIDADGNIYFGIGFDGWPGGVYALRPDGSQKWFVSLTNGVLSSPAIDPNGMIYIGACDGKAYALNPDGTTAWTFETGSSVVSSPALGADSSVIFGSYDGNIYCLRDVTSKDLTPPTTPVVTAPDSISEGSPITASWSATDPDSMVAEYVYAIGTTPGGSDIAGWTSAGIETSVSRDDLLLTGGQTYYVSVKARNPSQRWSEIGVSEGTIIVSGPAKAVSIAEAKQLSAGTRAMIESKIVTAVFSDCFFVAEPTRIAGIRCVTTDAQVQIGDKVSVTGTIGSTNEEKTIDAETITVIESGDPLKPLAICGGNIADALPCPVGLYVTLWGKAANVEADKFALQVCQSVGSATDVEVRCAGHTVSSGAAIAATGVLCRELVNGQPAYVLRTVGLGGVCVFSSD